MRDYEKLVKGLKYCFEHDDCGSRCPYFSPTTVCADERAKEAADAIEELQAAVPHWISVEDEPPKENGRYLVRYKRDVDLGDEETVHEDEIRIMRFFVDDGWRYPIICNDHVRLVNEEVTHWMPLPTPPTEGVE